MRHKGFDLGQNLSGLRSVVVHLRSHRRGKRLELIFGRTLLPAVVHLVLQPARGLGEKCSHVRNARPWSVRLSRTARSRPTLPQLIERSRLARKEVRRKRPQSIVPRPIPLKGLGRWDDETHPFFAVFLLPGGLDRPLFFESG